MQDNIKIRGATKVVKDVMAFVGRLGWKQVPPYVNRLETANGTSFANPTGNAIGNVIYLFIT